MKTMILMLAALLALYGRPVQAQEVVVVVNDANPVSALTVDKASQMFLKKLTKWDYGVAVQPVDLDNGQTRERFSKKVHKRSSTAVRSYWQQQIFAGKNVPPSEKQTEADVLEYVRAHPGAIGYVSAKAELIPGVKAVSLK